MFRGTHHPTKPSREVIWTRVMTSSYKVSNRDGRSTMILSVCATSSNDTITDICELLGSLEIEKISQQSLTAPLRDSKIPASHL